MTISGQLLSMGTIALFGFCIGAIIMYVIDKIRGY